MNHYDTFVKTLFVLLFAFFLSWVAFAQTPAWALGEQPNFRGTIANWTLGDAVAPGESAMYGISYSGDPEGADVGYGSVKSNGHFSFGLQRGAGYGQGGSAPDLSLCPSAQRSNPKQKFVVVSMIQIPALYKDGAHARPGGAIILSVGRPPLNATTVYLFVYATASGTVKGGCTFEGQTASINLDLRKGWNSVGINASKRTFKTAAIPATARWYFVNPLTAPNQP